ncbi:snake venom 5'-nucleotidase [Lepeophtheirus salmonis]|uniref:snake venom 5'-nucleotidase n=1 Tax=Lepeophtheirus salmonis TaxID=72036 RepID=UPI001AE1E927|nr:snake venom 5'-nucleotidase-like [Lepeophtheirus salmonis]
MSILIQGLVFYILLEIVTPFQLNIIHINDIHVRMEEIDSRGETCSASSSRCFGGLARVKYLADNMKRSLHNPLFLNGGDFYQGTNWYSFYKWKAVTHFSNQLGFDAMALGNHEFDDGNKGLKPFLEGAKFPIICANIDASKDPILRNKFQKSITINVGGKRIGIVGYVTLRTEYTSQPDDTLVFTEEVEAITKEAKNLKGKGVDIIIALGHSGYDKDQEIARKIPEIDVVVGGHSHSFLYHTNNGASQSGDYIEGDYPTMVRQPSGKQVPVVQAFAFTKYLGKLTVNFDINNRVTSAYGNPVLLDQNVREDVGMKSELKEWKKSITAFEKSVVGVASVDLIPSQSRESNLGNVVTDSMLYGLRSKYDVRLAIFNSGSLRSTINAGRVTQGDILKVIPYGNPNYIVKLSGRSLINIFELWVNGGRGFLQVSGFKVFIDKTRRGGFLVKVLSVSRHNPRMYCPLKKYKLYPVAIPSYIAGGGERYSIIPKKEHGIKKDTQTDQELLANYFKAKSPISMSKRDGRILIHHFRSASNEFRSNPYWKTLYDNWNNCAIYPS